MLIQLQQASLANITFDKLTRRIVYVHIACKVGRLWHAIHLIDPGPWNVFVCFARNKSREILPEYTEGDSGDYGAPFAACNHTHASSTNTPLLSDEEVRFSNQLLFFAKFAFPFSRGKKAGGTLLILTGGVEVVMGNFQVQPMPHCSLEMQSGVCKRGKLHGISERKVTGFDWHAYL